MAIDRKHFNRVAFYTPSTGTGSFSLGAVFGSTMLLPADAGMVNGDKAGYVIIENGDVEWGSTTASGSVNTFSRTVIGSKIANVVSTAAMNLAGTATVRFVELADVQNAAANALNAAGDTMTGALNYAATQTIASAGTTNIAGATSNSIIISGTTTITALGTVAAGAVRFVQFSGALILTHNATSLILPGGSNITTAAGDSAVFVSLGSGNWRCLNYQRASGAAIVESAPANATNIAAVMNAAAAKSTLADADIFAIGDSAASFALKKTRWDEIKILLNALYLLKAGGTMTGAINYAATATVASATTTDIGAATSNAVIISGTTTITGLGTIAAGALRYVQFSGALTLTHNGTSLILPGAASITTAAGDSAIFVSLGSGNWRCLNYQLASGKAVIADTVKASGADIIASTDDVKFVTAKAIADSHAVLTLTDGATVNWAMTSGYNARLTLGGNRTLATPTGALRGRTYVLELVQDGTGSRTLTWPATTIIDWGSAGAPTLSTAAGKIDIVTLYCLDAGTPLFRASFNKAS